MARYLGLQGRQPSLVTIVPGFALEIKNPFACAACTCTLLSCVKCGFRIQYEVTLVYWYVRGISNFAMTCTATLQYHLGLGFQWGAAATHGQKN
jgi:hypothetical protein